MLAGECSVSPQVTCPRPGNIPSRAIKDSPPPLFARGRGEKGVIDNFSEYGKKNKALALAPSTQYFAFTFKVVSASLLPSPGVLGRTAATRIILEESGQQTCARCPVQARHTGRFESGPPSGIGSSNALTVLSSKGCDIGVTHRFWSW